MARRTKTGFDRYFDERMRDPSFAAEYTQARTEIDALDGLIRALDDARERTGITKAELARRIDAKPEIVRRLLTDPEGNPTMSTVLRVAAALGCHLELVPDAGRRVVRRPAAARTRRVG
jgi:DNA-binding phage protein